MTDMTFIEGFTIGAERSRAAKEAGKQMQTFDWNKAAQIIAERRPDRAEAGLQGDWVHTGGQIWPIEDTEYTYLASMWAIPCLRIDGEDIPCHCDEDGSGWNANTQWPASARKILD